MIGIDTNVLVRYLAHDDPGQTPIATRFIDALSPEGPGHIATITLVELTWMLAKRFHATPAEVLRTTILLLSDARFVVQDAVLAWQAVETSRNAKVGLSDALIASVNKARGCSHTVTFDERAARMPGMALLR